MAEVAVVLAIASAGMQVAQGFQQRSFARQEASQQRKIGRAEAAAARRAGDRLIGEQRVAFAAGGVDVTTGTPLEVLGQTAREMELEALSSEFDNRVAANRLKFEGNQAATEGILGATTTLLGAAFKAHELGMFPKSGSGVGAGKATQLPASNVDPTLIGRGLA